MTTDNPFAPQTESKKRLVSATLTEQQADALEALRLRMNASTTAAVLKAGLAELMEKYPPKK